MSKKQILFLAQISILSALILLMTFVPQLGYINYGLMAVTLIHIPVIVGGGLTGPYGGLILGIVWGVSCWANAMMTGTLAVLWFMNPLISVLPRVIVGLLSGVLFNLFGRITQKMPLRCVLTAVCATLSNTILVFAAILIFGSPIPEFGDTINVLFTAALAINVPVEIISACLITAGVVTAVKKAKLA